MQRRLATARAALLALLAVLMGAPAPAAETAALLAHFGRQHGVTSWPRLRDCGYDRPWTGVAGTVLTVQTGPQASALATSGETALRKGLACQVTVRHRLENWPADLPSGTYVVAASAPDTGRTAARPWRLVVVGVARGLSVQQVEAAARHVDEARD